MGGGIWNVAMEVEIRDGCAGGEVTWPPEDNIWATVVGKEMRVHISNPGKY